MDATDLVLVTDTIAMIRNRYEFGAECAENELRRIILTVRLTLDEVGNCSTVGLVPAKRIRRTSELEGSERFKRCYRERSTYSA